MSLAPEEGKARPSFALSRRICYNQKRSVERKKISFKPGEFGRLLLTVHTVHKTSKRVIFGGNGRNWRNS